MASTNKDIQNEIAEYENYILVMLFMTPAFPSDSELSELDCRNHKRF